MEFRSPIELDLINNQFQGEFSISIIQIPIIIYCDTI